MLGVAYKNDIDDYRESPALRVIDILQETGAKISYYDPYIPEYKHKGETFVGHKELTKEVLQEADIVVVLSAHSKVDYDLVQQHATIIFDTKNAMSKVVNRDNIELL